MHTSHPRLPGELTFMALVVAFSAFMLWSAFQISGFESVSSPGVFPMVCAATMLVTGVMSLRQTAKGHIQNEQGLSMTQLFVLRLAPPQLVAFAALVTLYMLMLERTGFLLTSYIFLLLSMRVLGSKRMLLNVGISLLVLAAIFIVFRTAFSVVLPAGSWVGAFTPEMLR